MSVHIDDLNRLNFQYVCSRLEAIEFFPFFGTLLGLVRNGDLISGDDDIDFYVNSTNRLAIIQAFENSEILFDLNAPINQSMYFLQGVREVEGKKSFVDFYFFESDPKENYLIERWNFSGRWRRKSNAIHVPRSLIYPLREVSYLDRQLCLPADSEGCCRFLYGKNWQIPLVKRSQYRMTILRHSPLIYRNRLLDKIGILFLKIVLVLLNPIRLFR